MMPNDGGQVWVVYDLLAGAVKGAVLDLLKNVRLDKRFLQRAGIVSDSHAAPLVNLLHGQQSALHKRAAIFAGPHQRDFQRIFVLGKFAGLLDPMFIIIVLLTLFLLWTERKAFAGLIH